MLRLRQTPPCSDCLCDILVQKKRFVQTIYFIVAAGANSSRHSRAVILCLFNVANEREFLFYSEPNNCSSGRVSHL